jgi:predicted DNA-binding transcriptional regulator AlpA
MGERVFNAKEAARILGCSRATVYRLLKEGWLNGPGGRRIKDGNTRVTEKSVFQLMIIECLSHFPTRTLRQFKNKRKNFSYYFSQNANANCLSSSEGEGATVPSPQSLPQESIGQSKRCLHHDFAAEHQFSFGWMARQLVPDEDMALQDDLVQEMSLAVLQYGKAANCEYLLTLAENRAKNYLKYEERRGMMSLSEAQQASDGFEAKMANLKSLIETLVTRGVPREWIEEVLGKFEDEPRETGIGLGVAV